MAEGESTASSFIWALAFIIIVAILAGVLYFSGILSNTKKEKIDININPPAATR